MCVDVLVQRIESWQLGGSGLLDVFMGGLNRNLRAEELLAVVACPLEGTGEVECYWALWLRELTGLNVLLWLLGSTRRVLAGGSRRGLACAPGRWLDRGLLGSKG